MYILLININIDVGSLSHAVRIYFTFFLQHLQLRLTLFRRARSHTPIRGLTGRS